MAKEVHALDPDLAPQEVFTLQDLVGQANYPQRLAVALPLSAGQELGVPKAGPS